MARGWIYIEICGVGNFLPSWAAGPPIARWGSSVRARDGMRGTPSECRKWEEGWRVVVVRDGGWLRGGLFVVVGWLVCGGAVDVPCFWVFFYCVVFFLGEACLTWCCYS